MPSDFIFHQEINQYQHWLNTLGYSKSTVYYHPRFVAWFLGFVMDQGVERLEDITKAQIISYYEHLTKRSHQRTSRLLSPSYIGKQLHALRSFNRYLQHTKLISIPISIAHSNQQHPKITVLTPTEIQQLYKACQHTVLGLRDQAMLGLYYGCGLRRTEGVQVRMQHVDCSKRTLTIIRGKGYKRRVIPLHHTIAQDFMTYTNYSRPLLHPYTDHFLVSSRGNPCSQNVMIRRVQQLTQKANIPKKVGLHTLRHSIATHLFHAKMPLEHIQQFLGHSSLQSTQIYTHVDY